VTDLCKNYINIQTLTHSVRQNHRTCLALAFNRWQRKQTIFEQKTGDRQALAACKAIESFFKKKQQTTFNALK